MNQITQRNMKINQAPAQLSIALYSLELGSKTRKFKSKSRNLICKDQLQVAVWSVMKKQQ
jgi:hypothetical protein